MTTKMLTLLLGACDLIPFSLSLLCSRYKGNQWQWAWRPLQWRHSPSPASDFPKADLIGIRQFWEIKKPCSESLGEIQAFAVGAAWLPPLWLPHKEALQSSPVWVLSVSPPTLVHSPHCHFSNRSKKKQRFKAEYSPISKPQNHCWGYRIKIGIWSTLAGPLSSGPTLSYLLTLPHKASPYIANSFLEPC